MKNYIKRVATIFGFVIGPGFIAPLSNAQVPVDLAIGPLFNGLEKVHPNLLLDLSVEFPTVGAAYRDTDNYDREKDYIGYFNHEQCYVYVQDSKNDKDKNGKNINNADYGSYFRISAPADTFHECDGNSFSGNFMNWAASSSIDMLRLALTGGDRVVDEVGITVLQRAYLPDGTIPANTNFYSDLRYFPRKWTSAVNTNASKKASAPKKVTPFNTDYLFMVSCRNRILFSNTVSSNDGNSPQSDTCDTPRLDNGVVRRSDKSFGEFIVRVRVCDTDERPSRDLCGRYGNKYKPIGEIQKNAQKIRVGAFGYLTEAEIDPKANNYQDPNEYGGVLRAPIKYAGPIAIDVARNFTEIANPNAEWDANTGVFKVDPQYNGTKNSGLINYINKFGRTNPNRLGAYKGYDPISELYYESLRYLQNLPPLKKNIPNTDDNFDVVKNAADPVTLSCQANSILVIGDNFTHHDWEIPGNTADASTTTTYEKFLDPKVPATQATANATAVDVNEWTKRIGDIEPPLGNFDFKGLEHKSTGPSGSFYIAGLAYWAHTNDIRTDKKIRVKTYVIDVDENGTGALDANGSPVDDNKRAQQLYLAAKYGGFNDSDPFKAGAYLDGNPLTALNDQGQTVPSNKDWDSNGDNIPDTFFLASTPQKMIDAIQEAFKQNPRPKGTLSGIALTSSQIRTGKQFVYLPNFDSTSWSGSLYKLAADFDTNSGEVNIAQNTSKEWDAGEILTGKAAVAANPAWDKRKIYTSSVEANGTLENKEFSWTGLSGFQQKALSVIPDFSVQQQTTVDAAKKDEFGQQRTDFIRGDRSYEINQFRTDPNDSNNKIEGQFRSRSSLLGDIINSNPVLVSAPAKNVQGIGYQKFYDDRSNRTPAIYVGSNDGMLHAFNAETGVELFAYVPDAVIPNLSKLTDPNYIHQPYVDGGVTVSEAIARGSWRSVLTSSLGGGAQGVFALDVTNPLEFDKGAQALWEFTDRHDADIGNIVGKPVIAKFAVGLKGNVPNYKYFVVVPNGLNSYKDDTATGGKFNSVTPSMNHLFLLSLDKQKGDPWTQNSNYFKFKATDNAAKRAIANGLSTPALVVGNDGAVRYAYAGDLQGNLWRFDFSLKDGKFAQNDPVKIFTARDANNARQPITEQPRVVFGPGGGYVVLFGTGKFIEDKDAIRPFSTQSFYAILDTTAKDYKVEDRNALEKRSAQKTTFQAADVIQIEGDAFVYGTASGTKKGWYLDFADSENTGERSVTNALVAYGRVFFNTLILNKDICLPPSGRSYSLAALSGLPVPEAKSVTGYVSQIGLLSSPILFSTEDPAAQINPRNSIGQRTKEVKYAVTNTGTGGKNGQTAPAQNGNGQLDIPAGRFSWREILNWLELRNSVNN